MRSWAVLCGVWALLALLAWPLPHEALDWQPGLAASQPWRSLTGALVHHSPMHLGANLAGCAVLALLGWRAQLDARATLAAALAWPLTQWGLLLRPELLHFGGLSGVLHAAVAVAAVQLIGRSGRERWIGGAIAAGLLVKVVIENPLGPALQASPGWDVLLATFSHLCGAITGGICAVAVNAWAARTAR
jgi:rhomboid family GlyGly-CTERM serine protease